MLQTLAILVGLTASQGLGYLPGGHIQLQNTTSISHTEVFYNSANKYIGDGYSYGGGTTLRFGKSLFAGPGVYASHTSTSQWDKTSIRPTANIGWRTSNLQTWLTAHLHDTSPNHIRGITGVLQGRINHVVIQPSITWLTFTQGHGWSVQLLAGWNF